MSHYDYSCKCNYYKNKDHCLAQEHDCICSSFGTKDCNHISSDHKCIQKPEYTNILTQCRCNRCSHLRSVFYLVDFENIFNIDDLQIPISKLFEISRMFLPIHTSKYYNPQFPTQISNKYKVKPTDIQKQRIVEIILL